MDSLLRLDVIYSLLIQLWYFYNSFSQHSSTRYSKLVSCIERWSWYYTKCYVLSKQETLMQKSDSALKSDLSIFEFRNRVL